MSIRETALGKRGTFANVKYSRPCKVKKSCVDTITKVTVASNVRIGAQYDALQSTKDAKGVKTTAEAHNLNSGLKGMSWVSYPTILKSDKTNKEYVRIETNKNSKFDTHYFKNGVEVNKSEIADSLLASEKNHSGEMPTVMNIGLDTIQELHWQGKRATKQSRSFLWNNILFKQIV